MPINWPTWVTDGTPIPAQYLVPAKRAVFILAAAEKLRLLHQAIGHWYRVSSGNLNPDDAPAVTALEQQRIAEYAPYIGAGYDFARNLGDAPTYAEFQAWHVGWYSPKSDRVQDIIALGRSNLADYDIDWVNLATI